MQIHTAYDVMKEFLITDAELVGQYGIPKIPKTFIHPGKRYCRLCRELQQKDKEPSGTGCKLLRGRCTVSKIMESAGQVYGAFKMFSCSHYARFQHIGRQEWNAVGYVLVEQIPQSCTGSLHDLE